MSSGSLFQSFGPTEPSDSYETRRADIKLYDDEISDMSLAEMPLLDHIRNTYILEVSRYIENVVDISLISMYRYLIGTLDVVFFLRYIDIVSVTSEISVIFGYFNIHFRTF